MLQGLRKTEALFDAPAESFLKTLKVERVYQARYNSGTLARAYLRTRPVWRRSAAGYQCLDVGRRNKGMTPPGRIFDLRPQSPRCG